MENQKSMMKYHQINVALSSGAEVILKVKGVDYYAVKDWLSSLPGIAKIEDVKATLPMRPHTVRKNPSKITLARMAAGMSQQELADLLGVSRTQEQRWEYGYNRVRADTLSRIADALGVDVADLIQTD